VEDDAAIRDAAKRMLEHAGYKVTDYADANSLLNKQFEAPDLFILDKQLEGIDGLDLCRFLKNCETTRMVPVIIVSASTQIAERASLAGADDALEKPFKMKTLLTVIAKHI
jgi:DNA-binding response OmpR family regulator